MPTSEARVQTQRAGRYLTQLCRHATAISGRAGQHAHEHVGPAHEHPRMRNVDWSDTDATLNFDQGRCTLHAEPDALDLRAEADDAASLRRIEGLIAADLERFGTREHLTVTWHNGNNDGHDDDGHDAHDRVDTAAVVHTEPASRAQSDHRAVAQHSLTATAPATSPAALPS
jgi:hypothetical protein